MFSATKVAKAGLVASAALQKIMDLEKEVSKLRHHLSVLSKRNHLLQKEADGRKKEEEAVSSEVASPDRVEEPEPRVVAELLERMSSVIVAEEEEDVWVAPVAKPAVAESRVALVVNEPEVVLVRLPKGKRRRTCEGEGSEVKERVEREVGVIVATSIPRAPRGIVGVVGAPVGPRSMGIGRGVVNPNFPLFFNPARRFGRDHENLPVGGGRRRRQPRLARGDLTRDVYPVCDSTWAGLALPLVQMFAESAWCVSTGNSET